MGRGAWLAMMIAMGMGCASEAEEPDVVEPSAGGESTSATADLALVFGRDAAESNSSVDETRITPVKVTWTDAAGAPHERIVMQLRSGEGEGHGSFARLDELDWPEAATLLRDARPEGTTHTLYFDQGRWGWLGLHLIPEGDTVRVVAQRYDELNPVGSTEATIDLTSEPESLLEAPAPRP